MMTDKTKFKHAHLTGQAMRDHWGPIVDRIAADSLSQHCPNCEAQAAEIEAYGRSLQLKQTLIEEQAAEIEKLREALTKIGLRKWNSMTQGCNAAREANDIARAALGETK